MTRKKIALLIVLVLLGIQAIRPSRAVPKIDSSKDFLTIYPGEKATKELFKAACYDCHSYETKYPWYTYVAPVSFWIAGHVRNGRKKLNFSTLGTLDAKDQGHLMHECASVIEEGRMPPKGYVRMHSNAHLTEADKKALIEWFNKNS